MVSIKKAKKMPRGRPFTKGDKRAGRPKGATNKVTRDARSLCLDLVSHPDYQATFQKAWLARKLPPRLEELVWSYAYGKPSHSAGGDGITLLDILAEMRAGAAPADDVAG